jgi:hypothetical protein
MFVKPTPFRSGDPAEAPRPRVVRHEGRALMLPATGGHVPETTYWWRRLRDGDVELATPPEAEPTQAKGEAS